MRIDHNHGVTWVQSCDSDLLRIRHFRNPDLKTSKPFSLIRHSEARFVDVDRIVDDADRAVGRTGNLCVCVNRGTGLVQIEDADGNVRFSEAAIRMWDCDAVPKARLDFISPEGEVLLGGGQFQHGCMNLRNGHLAMQHYNTGIPLPFFVSSKGYGLLWDGTCRLELNPELEDVPLERFDARQRRWCFFHARSAGRHVFVLKLPTDGSRPRLLIDGQIVIAMGEENAGPEVMGVIELDARSDHDLVVEGNITACLVRRPEQAATTAILAHHQDVVDYSLVLPRQSTGVMREIIAGYRRLTGAASLLPRWAMGYWHSRNTYRTQDETLAAVRDHRARGIPLDVIVQDYHYWPEGTWGSHNFDPERFPDPGGMMARIHEEHARCMISCWPAMTDQCDCHADFAEKGYLLPKQIHPLESYDPFNADARRHYWRLLADRLGALGVDGYWLDGTEPGFFYDLTKVQTAAGPGSAVANVYCLEHARAVFDGHRADDAPTRLCTLTRSAYAGQQAFGSVTWSGDICSNFINFRQQICAGLQASVAGIPFWHTDIGGHYGSRLHDPEFQELLVRWFQTAAFWPIMRNHGIRDTAIWSCGETVESCLRQAIELRYQLIDYWYTLAASAHYRDASLIEPLIVRFGHDDRVHDVADQFMAGPAFMVCPITEFAARERQVYLPINEGGWFDFHSKRHHEGGQYVTAEAPLERMPLFVPAGSVVPIGPPRQWCDQSVTMPMELRIHPGADSVCYIYFDAGDGFGYERGEFAWLKMRWIDAANELHLSCNGRMPDAGPGFAGLRITRIVDAAVKDVAELDNARWIDGKFMVITIPN